MKFSAQEEYGLRFLLRIGKLHNIKEGVTIPEISRVEGISQHTVAKILRLLRIGGYLQSERGQAGGYTLAKPSSEIKIGDVIKTLGGRLYDDDFCNHHSGVIKICSNSIDCSIRSLWKSIQDSVDKVVNNLTLQDLMGNENAIFEIVNGNREINPDDSPI